MTVDPRRAAFEYCTGKLRGDGVWHSEGVLMRGIDLMAPEEAKEVLALHTDELRSRARSSPDRWDPTYEKMPVVFWHHNY